MKCNFELSKIPFFYHEISLHHYIHSYFGWMTGLVVARGREAPREMARGFLDFAKSALLGQTWGESVFFEPMADGGYRDVQLSFITYR